MGHEDLTRESTESDVFPASPRYPQRRNAAVRPAGVRASGPGQPAESPLQARDAMCRPSRRSNRYPFGMSHMCGTTCKRKQTPPVPCATCGLNGGSRRPHATPQQIGAAVDMYFDGLSYRRVAENIEEYFGRKTNAVTIMRWVHDYADRAHEIVHDTKIPTALSG